MNLIKRLLFTLQIPKETPTIECTKKIQNLKARKFDYEISNFVGKNCNASNKKKKCSCK